MLLYINTFSTDRIDMSGQYSDKLELFTDFCERPDVLGLNPFLISHI
ncbi:MAG: hypothetical protein HND39_03570 [Ignavibacteriota bacterium]|nr:hypothetical protein [Ignavibacteriales bacterium]MCC7093113.1 hypothetical protein [Ignavibacteriaceae bacterium]MEB2296225.1 hypothetical protein [Ignavibacteria bacterium]QKJ95428.1 MAG: hypothetical protein HND39_03570 [Ignavibacteriota bacterium]MCZ7615851.1 hypothetical protein [Ignavibacteriaceae bacterium]